MKVNFKRLAKRTMNQYYMEAIYCVLKGNRKQEEADRFYWRSSALLDVIIFSVSTEEFTECLNYIYLLKERFLSKN